MIMVMKKLIVALSTASLALIAGRAYCEDSKPTASDNAGAAPTSSSILKVQGGQAIVVTGTAQVLDPTNYVGQVRAGYAAAKEIPEVCAKLFCYCGCDGTDIHGSLLDCFTSDHGVDCHICQEESILALKFYRKGKSIKEIQKYIDQRYAREYPFEEETEIYKKYKAERLWGNKSGSSSGSTKSETVQLKPSESSGEKRKLKKDGSCCASDKDKD